MTHRTRTEEVVTLRTETEVGRAHRQPRRQLVDLDLDSSLAFKGAFALQQRLDVGEVSAVVVELGSSETVRSDCDVGVVVHAAEEIVHTALAL
jgi:hypothetical protein